jgi:hypothetical protein
MRVPTLPDVLEKLLQHRVQIMQRGAKHGDSNKTIGRDRVAGKGVLVSQILRK